MSFSRFSSKEILRLFSNNISISFDQNMSSVKVYDPTIGTEAISTHNNTGSISLEMGVDIAILEIEK